jgi:hypothetical protein
VYLLRRYAISKTGWWFGTCFFILGNIGNNSPNLLLFFRGVEKNRNICARTLVFAGPGMMWVWTISIPADKWINSKSGLLLVSLPADGH